MKVISIRLLTALLLAAAAAACANPAEEAVRPEQITDVDLLYGANCAGCHGADGRHGVAQPLNDAVYLALVGEARLRDVIARGVPGTPMTAFAKNAGGTLTDEQVLALVKGLQRTWGSAAAPNQVPLPPYSADDAVARGSSAGDPERGRAVFSTYCARCHGDRGQGGASAGSVVDAAYLKLTSDQSLRTTVIVGRREEASPDWRGYAAGRTMNDQEIADVVAWLATHRGSND